MADTKISALSDGGAILATDQVPVNRGGSNFRVTVGGGRIPQPRAITGHYYSLASGANALDEAGWNEILFVTPFFFSSAETWTRIGCSTGGFAAAKVRLGIYSSDSNGLPSALLLDSGELDASGSGDLEATISQALSANTLYWMAFITNSADLVIKLCGWDPGVQAVVTFLLGHNGGCSNYVAGAISDTATYGALPDPFPNVNFAGTSKRPLVWLRKV